MPGDVLVGRRLAMGALRAAVDSAVGGSGGVVVLAGDAGMGKTALARETVAYAKTKGAIEAWGVCADGDGAPGYWPWIQVMRTLDTDARDLLTDGSDGLLADDATTRFRVFDAITTRLRERSARQPLIVVLDDLHWADVSSLRLLLFATRHLHDAALLVLATYRDVDVAIGDESRRDLLAELAGQAELLRLTGLTADEVGQLVQKVCDARAPDAVNAVVHERTGGNPFFVQQIARLLATQDVPLDRAPVTGVPPAIGDVLARRLELVPDDVVRVLEIAAVVGRQFPIATVAALAGDSPDAVLPLLDRAVRAAIVEHDTPGAARFTHDLFREVLDDNLPTARRAELHLAVADFLEQHAPSGAPAEIAHHRTAALPLGERGRAVTALVAAGRDAAARTAFDEAASHLGNAVDLSGGTATVDVDTLCEYADALRRAGQRDAATDAFLAAAARARAGGAVSALSRAAFGLHRVEKQTESSRPHVIALLDDALDALEHAPRDAAGPSRWMLAASLARELADGPDRDVPRATALADAAIEGARADHDDAALAYALFALIDVRWAPGTASERVGLAEELAAAATSAGETELMLEAHLAKLVALLELGDPRFAVELDTFTRLAEQSAIPRYVYLARSRHATRACLTGPFARADELIESAATYGDRIGEPDAWGVQASQLVGLALLRHDWTRLHALATARGELLTPPEFAVHEHAWLLVEAGERDAAAALVASMPATPPVYRWREAALLATEAELAAVVGDQRRCQSLYEQMLPMKDGFAIVGSAVFTTGPISLQLGLLAAALQRWDDAVVHLEDAIVRCDRLGALLIGARAREELASITTRRGETNVAQRDGNAWRRQGDVWTLTFAGRTVQLRDMKGLRDLAVLLSAPGREIAAAELAAGPAAPVEAWGTDAVLDEQARESYRDRLDQLETELAAADAAGDRDRSARLTIERDALLNELRRATGLGGRRRRLGDATERARSTVTARIRDAIGRVERDHPELGAHLRTSVITGARCAYRPGETVEWVVSQV